MLEIGRTLLSLVSQSILNINNTFQVLSAQAKVKVNSSVRLVTDVGSNK